MFILLYYPTLHKPYHQLIVGDMTYAIDLPIQCFDVFPCVWWKYGLMVLNLLTLLKKLAISIVVTCSSINSHLGSNPFDGSCLTSLKNMAFWHLKSTHAHLGYSLSIFRLGFLSSLPMIDTCNIAMWWLHKLFLIRRIQWQKMHYN